MTKKKTKASGMTLAQAASKAGKASAKKKSKAQLTADARKAAKARWAKPKKQRRDKSGRFA